MFDFDLKRYGGSSSLWSAGSESREDAVAWLREKDLVFFRDERCGFTFDAVALARLGDLYNVQCQVEEIETFARDLRKNGGFVFFREHYPGKHNKVYNGTHVFWCPGRMEEALPMLSAELMHFYAEFPEAIVPYWMKIPDDGLLDSNLKKRKEATEVLETQGETRGPRIT